MLSCDDVAKYFLSLVEEDAGDNISNLKLQKLVYYAQGFYLARYGKPLFKETIEAWTHGPVLPDLYRKYRQFEANPIPKPQDINLDIYDNDTQEVLDHVYMVYGQYSAWKLRDLTHQEPTWKNAYKSQINAEITHAEMEKYFKTQLLN